MISRLQHGNLNQDDTKRYQTITLYSRRSRGSTERVRQTARPECESDEQLPLLVVFFRASSISGITGIEQYRDTVRWMRTIRPAETCYIDKA